jgi:lysophospholipase L1-like esterase
MSSTLRCSLVILFIVSIAGINVFGQVQSSEPAPVPKVVANTRPTAEEVQLIKDSLAKFFETAAPEVKAINQKYPKLVAVQVPPNRVNTAIVPFLAPNFQKQHDGFLEVAKQGNIDVLFMGDSITDFWRSDRSPYAGKPVFDKYYGDMKVANFGIAGDTTQGVLFRLKNGEGQGFSPKAVMLMIGTNNTMRNSAGEIAEGIGAVVLELQKDFPNATISKLHDGKTVFYLDIGAKFLDDKGNIPKDVMSDALHPTTKGYEIWAEAVKEPLANLLK